jgi:CBS-domain-containing membrane protein
MRHRLVLNIMTPAEQTVAVQAGSSFKEIARILVERRISAVPVVDDRRRVIGVVSEADLLLKESRLERHKAPVFGGRQEARVREKAEAAVARDLMTSPAVTVGPGDDAVRAARLMREHRVKRLPVVDEDGRLSGIISRHDLLGLFTRPDAEIRSEILDDVLLRTLWIDPREVDVQVTDGLVRLRGTVETRSVAEMVSVLVRRTDGVVHVVDEIGYARDDSGYKPSPGQLHGVFERRRPGT